MTYKESYMKCETFEEFKEEVIKDIKVALFFMSVDRIKNIEKIANEVCKEKGWSE